MKLLDGQSLMHRQLRTAPKSNRLMLKHPQRPYLHKYENEDYYLNDSHYFSNSTQRRRTKFNSNQYQINFNQNSEDISEENNEN